MLQSTITYTYFAEYGIFICLNFYVYEYSLVPILREEYSFDGLGTSDYYHSVAVIKKGTLPYVNTMDDLRELKACFAKVCFIDYTTYTESYLGKH